MNDGPSQFPRNSSSESSIGELFGEVSRDLSTLLRQELELAKAEMRVSAVRAGRGAGMFGGAVVGVHFTLLFLSVALWWALGDPLGLGWSAVIVAAGWAVIAGALAFLGKNETDKIKGIPQTAETVGEIPEALKGDETT